MGMIGDRDCEGNDVGDMPTSSEPLVLIMVNRLLPIAPKESCSCLALTEFDREGDLGRVEPVKRPLNADTDLCVVAWERTDKGDDLSDGSGVPIGRIGLVVWRKPTNSGSVALLGIGDEIIPCVLMVNMTSMSPLGSLPSRM